MKPFSHLDLDRLGIPRFRLIFNPCTRRHGRRRLTLDERDRIRFYSLTYEARRLELCKAMGLDENGRPK